MKRKEEATMLNQSDVLLYLYCRIFNLLDNLESSHIYGKAKWFNISGNAYDTTAYFCCIEISDELHLFASIDDIEMQYDLYDREDVEACIDDIVLALDKIN